MGNKRISDYANETSITSTTEFLAEKASGDYVALTYSVIRNDIRNNGGITTQTGNYTITDSDGYNVLVLSGASANATFTLPTLADNQSRILEFINADSADSLIIDGEGAETISGMASFTILPGHTCRIIATASEWKILSSSFEVIPVSGTNYAVYTKTFSGNLDGDSRTDIAHGVTATKIISLSGFAYDDLVSEYMIVELYQNSATSEAYTLSFSTSNISFFGVGSYLQGNAYKATIKYYVD